MPVIVDALNAIECPNAAGITAEAIAVLRLEPGCSPDDVRNAAEEIFDAHDERSAELYRLDQRFYEYPDPIEDRLFAYIRAHRDDISLS